MTKLTGFFNSSTTTYFLIALAVICNVSAQACMKLAAGKASLMSFAGMVPIAISVGFYGVSFILTARILGRMELSVAGPMMAGATFALVFLVSTLLFHENITSSKLLGLLFITIGVFFLSRGNTPPV